MWRGPTRIGLPISRSDWYAVPALSAHKPFFYFVFVPANRPVALTGIQLDRLRKSAFKDILADCHIRQRDALAKCLRRKIACGLGSVSDGKTAPVVGAAHTMNTESGPLESVQGLQGLR